VTLATVHNIERARLRRAVASGVPSLVLDAVERVLDTSPTTEEHGEAADGLYGVFWLALEDEGLAEQAGSLDLRIAQEAAASA